MPDLVRLLLAALEKEQNDQVRGNVLDLLQELGYGFSAGFQRQVLRSFVALQSREVGDAFGQVIGTHLAFAQEYLRQRDDGGLMR